MISKLLGKGDFLSFACIKFLGPLSVYRNHGLHYEAGQSSMIMIKLIHQPLACVARFQLFNLYVNEETYELSP
ncbi:MAG TPA: hypothetical protein VM260_06200 [Pirellula sp.]|nr:hypothetical protein [Pirellula sp.]